MGIKGGVFGRIVIVHVAFAMAGLAALQDLGRRF
jgi:hypothetical protein